MMEVGNLAICPDSTVYTNSDWLRALICICNVLSEITRYKTNLMKFAHRSLSDKMLTSKIY